MNSTQYNQMNEYGCFLKPEDTEAYKAPKKKKKKLFKSKKPKLPTEFITYEPCVHLHFKPELVDRDCLTKDQYFDMLATPKGYRWMGEANCQNPNLGINKKKKKKVKAIMPMKEKPRTTQEAGDFANDFVEDMWDVMSPEITDRLIDFLVNEFGMSSEEAEDFIDCKSSVGKQAVYKKKKSKTLIGIGPKYKWVKEFSDVFAKRIEQYIVSMLLTQRTPRARRLAEKILEYLCDLTGEKTSLQSPKTKIQKTIVLIADRLALWIEGLLRDTEKIVKKTPSIISEEPPSEEGDIIDKEKEIKEKPSDTKKKDEPKSKEEPSKEKDKKEPVSKEKKEEKKDDKEDKDKDKADGKEKEKIKEDDKEKLNDEKVKPYDDTEDTEEDGKQNLDIINKEKEKESVNEVDKEDTKVKEANAEEQKEEVKVDEQQDKATVEEKRDEPVAEDKIDDVEEKKDDIKAEVNKTEDKENAPDGNEEMTGTDKEKAGNAKDTPDQDKKKHEDEDEEDKEAVKEDDKDKTEDKDVQKERKDTSEVNEKERKEEIPRGKEDDQDKDKDEDKGEDKDKNPQETEKEEPKPDGPSIEKKDELPKTEKEEKTPYDEILDYLKDDITGTPKGLKTDRQMAIKDVLEKRVENIAIDKGGLLEDDIDDVTSRVAHWVDNIIKSTEQVKTPLSQQLRGSAYKIKKKSGSTLEVQKLSSNTVAQETAEARGVEPPPRERRVPHSSSPMNLKSREEWIDWAGKVEKITQQWGNFINNTINETEIYLDAKKNSPSEINWAQWIEKAKTDSLKYRAENERMKEVADIWGKKIDKALKEKTQQEKLIKSTELSS